MKYIYHELQCISKTVNFVHLPTAFIKVGYTDYATMKGSLRVYKNIKLLLNIRDSSYRYKIKITYVKCTQVDSFNSSELQLQFWMLLTAASLLMMAKPIDFISDVTVARSFSDGNAGLFRSIGSDTDHFGTQTSDSFSHKLLGPVRESIANYTHSISKRRSRKKRQLHQKNVSLLQEMDFSPNSTEDSLSSNETRDVAMATDILEKNLLRMANADGDLDYNYFEDICIGNRV